MSQSTSRSTSSSIQEYGWYCDIETGGPAIRTETIHDPDNYRYYVRTHIQPVRAEPINLDLTGQPIVVLAEPLSQEGQLQILSRNTVEESRICKKCLLLLIIGLVGVFIYIIFEFPGAA
jgi:hypothetical protein